MSSDEYVKCEQVQVKSQEYVGVQNKFTDMTGRPASHIVEVSNLYKNNSLI
jgi:hypothetical protein